MNVATAWILMRLYFTHRSVYSSVIIREPFPFRKHKWIQDIQRDNGQKVGVLETLISKWYVFIHFLTLWLRETCRRGAERLKRRGINSTKEKGLLNTLGPMHIWIHKDNGHMHRACTDMSLMGLQHREWKWTQTHILIQNLSLIYNHIQVSFLI